MESPFQHMVEHRDLGGDPRWMGVGQVDRACPQNDVLRLEGEARQKGDGRCDDLGLVRRVLTAIGFGKAQLIRQYECFPVFLKALRERLSKGMMGMVKNEIFKPSLQIKGHSASIYDPSAAAQDNDVS